MAGLLPVGNVDHSSEIPRCWYWMCMAGLLPVDNVDPAMVWLSHSDL
jgi:hypothetical protein